MLNSCFVFSFYFIFLVYHPFYNTRLAPSSFYAYRAVGRPELGVTWGNFMSMAASRQSASIPLWIFKSLLRGLTLFPSSSRLHARRLTRKYYVSNQLGLVKDTLPDILLVIYRGRSFSEIALSTRNGVQRRFVHRGTFPANSRRLTCRGTNSGSMSRSDEILMRDKWILKNKVSRMRRGVRSQGVSRERLIYRTSAVITEIASVVARAMPSYTIYVRHNT